MVCRAGRPLTPALSTEMVFQPHALTRRGAPPSPAPAGEGHPTGEGEFLNVQLRWHPSPAYVYLVCFVV